MDASNRKDVRRAEKAAEQREAARLDYIRRIMSEALGRAWMHQLLEMCHIGTIPFVAGHSDVTNFNCGEQNIGLRLWNDAMKFPVEYVLMMQEASHKEIVNERRDSEQRPTSGEHPGSADLGRDSEGPEPNSVGEYDPFADAGEET